MDLDYHTIGYIVTKMYVVRLPKNVVLYIVTKVCLDYRRIKYIVSQVYSDYGTVKCIVAQRFIYIATEYNIS